MRTTTLPVSWIPAAWACNIVAPMAERFSELFQDTTDEVDKALCNQLLVINIPTPANFRVATRLSTAFQFTALSAYYEAFSQEFRL